MAFQNHYRDRLRLANQITHEGFLVDPPCDRCSKMSEKRIVECRRIPSVEKCNNCIRAGRRCEHGFHSEKEWEKFNKAREKVDIDLAAMDGQFSSLEKESVKLQEETSKKQEEFLKEFLQMQKNISKIQKDISKALVKHSNLRRRRSQLNNQNIEMLSHDLDILGDSDDIPESPPFEDISLDGFSASEIDQIGITPGFLAQLGATNIPEEVPDN
jgi:hypothetical protein